ncbi:hypothetical protein Tco_0791052 [Tanacetum coccineum]
MGATAASMGVAVRALMIILSCLMISSLVYVIAIGALASFLTSVQVASRSVGGGIGFNWVIEGLDNGGDGFLVTLWILRPWREELRGESGDWLNSFKSLKKPRRTP